MSTCGPQGYRSGSGGAARTHAQAAARGFTMMELVIALTLAGLALVIAFPLLNSAPENLAADLQDFSLNLQVARDLGTSRGAHYRVRVTSQTAYVVEGPNILGGSGWAIERAINLRQNVQFAAADVGKIAEFDMRGLGVSTLPPVFTLTDVARGWSKQVTVNAEGMVDRT